jgi:hypothetical protein
VHPNNDLGGNFVAANFGSPLPTEMPGVAENNTRKVAGATLDPGLGGAS